MRADAVDQPLPVERVAEAENQVQDVGDVVPVPLADEQPVPDQLLGRRDAHRHRGQDARPAVLDPVLVDERDAVAHPVDQIDEVLAEGRLGEPVRVLEPRDEPGRAQRARGRDDRCRLEEQIEVLGLAVDAGVLVDGVGAGDDVGHARGVERLERALVDLALLLGDPEIAVGQGLSLFRGQPPRPAPSQIRHVHLITGHTHTIAPGSFSQCPGQPRAPSRLAL